MAGMDPFFLIFLKLTICGQLVAGHQQVDEALALAARGLIKPRITIRPFKEFPAALKMLVRSLSLAMKHIPGLTCIVVCRRRARLLAGS
jgi:D-arabinose 1-dehydrogenase-like Zn-dependent alcohol dehydrogenase